MSDPVAKLRRLRLEADMAHGAMMQAYARYRGALGERNRHRELASPARKASAMAEVRVVRDKRGQIVEKIPAGAEGWAKIEAEAAVAEEAYRRAEAEHAEAQAKWSALHRLVESCEAFLKSRGITVPRDPVDHGPQVVLPGSTGPDAATEGFLAAWRGAASPQGAQGTTASSSARPYAAGAMRPAPAALQRGGKR